MTYKKYIIAIDGPSGSGKTTLSKALASELGFPLLLTGKIYRLYAHQLIRQNIDLNNLNDVLITIKNLILKIPEDTRELDSEETAAIASKISSIPEVREIANQYQFDFIKNNNFAILEGRDIGTVICPDAELKIYLVSSPEIRAMRRYNELNDPLMTYEKILKDALARDLRDLNREFSPLKPAKDAVIIDNSKLLPQEQIRIVLNLLPKEILQAGVSSL